MPVELLRFYELCSKRLQYRGWMDAEAKGAALGGKRARLTIASVNAPARIVRAIDARVFWAISTRHSLPL
jgi:hypothetical protein